MHCLNCGADITNGLALCPLCQALGKYVFTYLPTYFRNLARWRPGRAGSRPVHGSRMPAGAFATPNDGEDRIERALDEAATALTNWARKLVNDRPTFPRPHTFPDALLANDLPADLAAQLNDDQPLTIAWTCAALDAHLPSIATLAWAADFLHDISHHETRLRKLTEQVAPGWYAGACKTCQHPTHVVPGLTWVTCTVCGTTTYARDHLDTILNEARDWIATPKRLAEAIVALGDTEQNIEQLRDRIRRWGDRGHLTPTRQTDRDGDQFGPKLYRLGDVLDHLAQSKAAA